MVGDRAFLGNASHRCDVGRARDRQLLEDVASVALIAVVVTDVQWGSVGRNSECNTLVGVSEAGVSRTEERDTSGVISAVIDTGKLDVVIRLQGRMVDELVGRTSVQSWSGEAHPDRGAGVTAGMGVIHGCRRSQSKHGTAATGFANQNGLSTEWSADVVQSRGGQVDLAAIANAHEQRQGLTRVLGDSH